MADPGTQLSIEPDDHGFTLRGEIDALTAPDLEEAITARLASGDRTIRLDMGAVTFVDSSGLRVVVSATEAARAVDGELIITAPSDPVRRLIELTGLADHVRMEPSSR